MTEAERPGPDLSVVILEWGRIGCIGFGGPPAHISLLRQLCVEDREWISEHEFEDAIAATNLLPGPASTQLAIYCAWRIRGIAGAIAGGISFIVPGLVLIIALSALFLSSAPPTWILGAGAGAGAAVAAVALQAAWGLMPGSWRRASVRWRWAAYVLAGAVAAAVFGIGVVLVLLGCGVIEVVVRHTHPRLGGTAAIHAWPLLVPLAAVVATGGTLALAWVAFKVGALSYGGGFVIIPLMQHDAVDSYHWMTDAQFLNAVALGQVTPGPVVQTIAVVGYAAAGIGGAVFAALIAFAPSFWFILIGADRFDRFRANPAVRSFLGGAGPAAIGAIAGAAVPLALAITERWQVPVLGAAIVALFIAKRGVVSTLLGAGVIGVAAALTGAPLPH